MKAFVFIRTRKRAALVLVLVIAVGLCLAVSEIGPVRRTIGAGVRSARSLIMAVLDSGRARTDSHGNYTNAIFLHHSVGHNLIRQGQLRELLRPHGIDLYDQDYNNLGLFRPDGSRAGYGYNVPGDNTDPDGLARIFEQGEYRWPLNTLSRLLQHEVIILKSCYLAVWKLNAETQKQQMADYLKVRDRTDRFHDKLFIILTSPPANPAETNPESAARARALSEWLRSEEFCAGHPNLLVFDLYGLLAGDDPESADCNTLRAQYRNGSDSHPNQRANKTIAPVLADFIARSVAEAAKAGKHVRGADRPGYRAGLRAAGMTVR